MNRNHMAALAVAALALGACGRDSTGPKSTLTQTEARDLAGSMASLAGGSAFSGSVPRAMSDGTYTFELTCPAGGTWAADVKATGSANLATRSAALDFSGTETSKQCATRQSDGGTIAVTGTSSFAAHIEIAAAKPATETFTQKGSFEWTKGDGTKGSCTVDVTARFDPVSQKATVSGTYCGITL